MGAPVFTPGPWGYELDEGDWNITYGPDLHHGPRVIAKVLDYAGEFQEPDARLIAAAPELYAVCEMIANGASGRMIREPLIAALAKARGQ